MPIRRSRSDADLLFAALRRPISNGNEFRQIECLFGRDLHAFVRIQEERRRKMRVHHRGEDRDRIGAIATADSARTDADDRELAGFALAPVEVVEVVHAVADELVRILPAALPECVADQHVDMTIAIAEAQDRSELDGKDGRDLLKEGLADTRDVLQCRIHADNDIGLIAPARNVGDLKVRNHAIHPRFSKDQSRNHIIK